MGRSASAWLLPPKGTSGSQQGRSRRDGTRTSRGRVARFTVAAAGGEPAVVDGAGADPRDSRRRRPRQGGRDTAGSTAPVRHVSGALCPVDPAPSTSTGGATQVDERVTNGVAGYDGPAGENPGRPSPRAYRPPASFQRVGNHAEERSRLGRSTGTRSDGTRALVLYGAGRRKGVAVGTRALTGATGLTGELGTGDRGARRGVFDVVRSTLIGT
jgi:hypothetical protein